MRFKPNANKFANLTPPQHPATTTLSSANNGLKPIVDGMSIIGCLCLIGVLLLTACTSFLSPGATYPPESFTPTITAISSVTPTIDWFPATATPTSAAATPSQPPTPTPGIRPELGEVLFKDFFTNEKLWQLTNAKTGSAAFGDNELSLVVKQPRWTVSSLYLAEFPADYYLELTLSPRLCKDGDSFGLLLRSVDEKTAYRYALSCEGLLRLELLKGGIAVPIQDWTLSAEIRPGGLQTVRLGAWVVGNEMRLYANGVYQFSAYRLIWWSGGFGLFARAAGETTVSAGFSDLIVRQPVAFPSTQTPSPTLTFTPTATIRPK